MTGSVGDVSAQTSAGRSLSVWGSHTLSESVGNCGTKLKFIKHSVGAPSIIPVKQAGSKWQLTLTGGSGPGSCTSSAADGNKVGIGGFTYTSECKLTVATFGDALQLREVLTDPTTTEIRCQGANLEGFATRGGKVQVSLDLSSTPSLGNGLVLTSSRGDIVFGSP